MTEEELHALIAKLRAVSGSFTPKEQAFTEAAFRSGIAMVEPEEVEGYTGITTTLFQPVVHLPTVTYHPGSATMCTGCSHCGGCHGSPPPPPPPPSPSCNCY
jgi:hypothetical protein